MAADAKQSLSLRLLDNGIDFILKGIDELFDDNLELYGDDTDTTAVSEQSYKYGVLNLFSGFLLLLKERLARHNPLLIYRGSTARVQAVLRSGMTPNTVNVDEALDRLRDEGLVAFTSNDLVIIRRMQAYRNAFEHHEVSGIKADLWQTLTTFLELIDCFLFDELSIALESYDDGRVVSVHTGGKVINIHMKVAQIASVWKRIIEQRQRDWLAAAEETLAHDAASQVSCCCGSRGAKRRHRWSWTGRSTWWPRSGTRG